MDKIKQWVALTVLAALAVLAGGWFLLVSPKRGEAADLRAQTATQQATNATLRTELQVLQAQAKELPKEQADLARVAAKIPEHPALPALIRALTAASTSAGVDFVSLTPGTPAPLVVAAPTPVAPPPGAAAPAAPATPGATAAAAPAPAGGTLTAIPVTITVVGDFFQVEQFVAALESLPRALRVSGVAVTPGLSPTAQKSSGAPLDGRSLTSTITGQVFLAAGAAPVTPVVAPTASPAS